MSDAVLGAESTAVLQVDTVPALMEFGSGGQTISKETRKQRNCWQ